MEFKIQTFYFYEYEYEYWSQCINNISELKMINQQNENEDALKLKIVEYSMRFGASVDDQMIDYIDKNFNFDQGYGTKTMLLKFPTIPMQRKYSKQDLIQRFSQAFKTGQAISFVKCQSVSVTDKCVIWRAKFTCQNKSQLTSMDYLVTSHFDVSFRFVHQKFEQMISFEEQQAAPPISHKDQSQFKKE